MKNMTTIDNVTCPFCSLACDDLKISCDGQDVRTQKHLPHFCQSNFKNNAHQVLDASAQINGKNVALEEAISQAAKLIESAQRPLLGGLLLDIKASQEAVKLAVDCNGVVDHANSNAILRNMKVIQNTGLVGATLSEVRVRSDFIIVIGDKILDNFPRLSERILSGKRPLLGERTPQFAFIGPWKDRIPEEISTDTCITVDITKEEIHDCIQMLSAVANGHSVNHVNNDILHKIIKKIYQSEYTCIFWDGSDLDYPDAELTIETLALLLRKLNQDVRCVGVPMGGNGTTFNNVCLWQTAKGTRTSFDSQEPVYDPIHNSTSKILANKYTDLFIWSASIRAEAPPKTNIPTIAIVRPDTPIEQPVDVYIPVGIPGIDHNGHIFRSDSVTILPLKQLRKSPLPSAAQVFTSIRQALSTKGRIQ